MSDQILARLDQLTAAFTRIADRASWVRAVFTVIERRVRLIRMGRPAVGGGEEAPTLGPLGLEDLQDEHEPPLVTELVALSDQAGILAAEMIESGLCRWRPESLGIDPYVSHDQVRWILLLLRMPPLRFHCRVRRPDGTTVPAFRYRFTPECKRDEREVTFRIDDYAQVCVSALAVLKAGALDGPAELKAGSLARPADRDQGTSKVKGKDINARMLKEMAENPECLDWSSREWANRLSCAESTVRGSRTWRVVLPNARAMRVARGAERMDPSRTHARGRRRMKSA
jgi:hypothetical protein